MKRKKNDKLRILQSTCVISNYEQIYIMNDLAIFHLTFFVYNSAATIVVLVGVGAVISAVIFFSNMSGMIVC